EVVERLVEPMLGGVYAGRAEYLSLAATMPRIATAARTERSLLAAARQIAGESAGRPRRPVFTTLARGLGTLPEALAAGSGAEIRTGTIVRELRRTERGWRLVAGPANAPEEIEADAVILALPAVPAARLLRADGPEAEAAVPPVA